MRLYGLFRHDDFDHIKSTDSTDKQLGAVISENINTKFIAFIFFSNQTMIDK